MKNSPALSKDVLKLAKHIEGRLQKQNWCGKLTISIFKGRVEDSFREERARKLGEL